MLWLSLSCFFPVNDLSACPKTLFWLEFWLYMLGYREYMHQYICIEPRMYVHIPFCSWSHEHSLNWSHMFLPQPKSQLNFWHPSSWWMPVGSLAILVPNHMHWAESWQLFSSASCLQFSFVSWPQPRENSRKNVSENHQTLRNNMYPSIIYQTSSYQCRYRYWERTCARNYTSIQHHPNHRIIFLRIFFLNIWHRSLVPKGVMVWHPRQ